GATQYAHRAPTGARLGSGAEGPHATGAGCGGVGIRAWWAPRRLSRRLSQPHRLDLPGHRPRAAGGAGGRGPSHAGGGLARRGAGRGGAGERARAALGGGRGAPRRIGSTIKVCWLPAGLGLRLTSHGTFSAIEYALAAVPSAERRWKAPRGAVAARL